MKRNDWVDALDMIEIQIETDLLDDDDSPNDVHYESLRRILLNLIALLKKETT